MASTLVIQLARFGDLIQTGRLIHALLRDGDTHLCLDANLVPLAKKLYPACHLHPIHTHGHANAHDVYVQNMACFTTLQGIPFSAVYTLNYAGMNSALCSLFPPEIVHGYIVQNSPHTVSNKIYHREKQWLHMMFRWITKRRTAPINLTDLWGLLAPRPLTPAEVHPMALPKGGGLGIVLAGRNARRSLPPEVLAPCITAIFQRMDAPRITFFGTEREQIVAYTLLRALRPSVSRNVVNLTGKTSFDELIAHVAPLDCLFTPDTGTMHLAAALGVPVEAYFLSSAWAYETGPYGLGHTIWQDVQASMPCNEQEACMQTQTTHEHALSCAHTFSDHGFLNRLMGFDFGEIPPSLRKLTTDFDKLGLILQDVADTSAIAGTSNAPHLKEEAQRMQLRKLLASLAPTPIDLDLPEDILPHIRNSTALSHRTNIPTNTFGTKTLIHESDWILPSTRP